jgi:flagellum-specific ATP synthase
MVDVASEEHKKNATDLKELYAVYREQEDLINIGAYQRGSNPKIDKAIQKFPEMEKFLRQGIEEHTDLEDTLDWLAQLNG